jgi:tetratricopeptide (TPR) repeat protein
MSLSFAAWSCASDSRGLPEPGAFVRRGEEALNAGRLDEARQIFLEAAADEPRAFLAWIGLARTADRRGDRAELDQAMTEAMARDPKTPASADLLGRTFLGAARGRRPHDKRYARLALGYFRRAAEASPDLPALRYHTGLAAWSAGELALAVAALEAAHQVEPDAYMPLRALLDLHRETGDPESVRRLLQEFDARGKPLPAAFDADREWAGAATSRAASRAAGAPKPAGGE